MTKEDLMQLYYLNKEITAWKEELERIRSTTEETLEEDVEGDISAEKTERKIRNKMIELENTRNKITRYILNIDDCQTRLIFKLRCLNLMSWNAVADRVGGMNSEDSVKKRFYRYLEKCVCK